MSNELAVRNVGELDFNKGFNEQQIALLKDTICKEATNDELAMFMYVCKRRRLDPFVKQIYNVKRWDSTLGKNVFTQQTGIDGLRVLAQRTGKYRGQTGPFWCGKDGQWVDVWTSLDFPVAAKVGVIHEDFKEPIYGVARWESYVQTTKDGKPTHMWKKMPESQLAKCAEALALRKAFPEDMSGLYSEDEVGSDNVPRDSEKINRINEALKPEADVVPTESVYVMTVGKYKGKTFSEVDPNELAEYVTACNERKEGKELSEDWITFLREAEGFFNNVK